MLKTDFIMGSLKELAYLVQDLTYLVQIDKLMSNNYAIIQIAVGGQANMETVEQKKFQSYIVAFLCPHIITSSQYKFKLLITSLAI